MHFIDFNGTLSGPSMNKISRNLEGLKTSEGWQNL